MRVKASRLGWSAAGSDESTYEHYDRYLGLGRSTSRAEPVIPQEGEALKKFVVLTYGFMHPTEEIKQEWGAWFASVGPQRVDPGSPFGRGTEITKTGRTDLTLDCPSLSWGTAS